jgi:ABC-2 type transport system ATP-binding protein
VVGTPLIRATSVSRRYRTRVNRRRVERQALSDVSIGIGAGQWVALLGANGSGKSTLLRLLAQIELPDEGAVEHRAESGAILTREQAARRTGVVFQTPGLDRLLTVSENLRIQAALYDISDTQRRLSDCIEMVGLRERAGDRVGTLSGGLARRADLARAMLSEPKVLMLDEPLAGLDVDSRQRFLEAVETLRAQDPSLTIVMATHNAEEIRLADAVVVLEEGRVVVSGEPAEIAKGVFGDCDLILSADGRHVHAAEEAGLRIWNTGGRVIIGGGRSRIEEIALRMNRDGARVELRSPDFIGAYPIVLGTRIEAGTDEVGGVR